MTNPYDKVLEQYNDRDAQNTARRERNARQKEQLLASPQVNQDTILKNLATTPDTRLSACIVARPPAHIKQLCAAVQQRLQDLVPGLWAAPQPNLHMTVLEVVSVVDDTRVQQCVELLSQNKPQVVAALHGEPRPVLDSPYVCFDANALALSFVTAANTTTSHVQHKRQVYQTVADFGLDMNARYYGPSAHVTLARFLQDVPPEKVEELVHGIEQLNDELASRPVEWRLDDFELVYGTNYYGVGHVVKLNPGS